MPRNGSGTYAPPAGQPVVTGTTISSTVFNALVADLGTEFTRSLATDGQTPMAASLPMGNNKITGLAAGVAASDAARLDQVSSSVGTLRTDLALTTGAGLIGTADGTTLEARLVGDFTSGALAPGVSAAFSANKTITSHAVYGFLANNTITYSAVGFQAHSSFNSNVTFSGNKDSDHHHDYQAYPHYGGSGTIGRLSCFWALPDVTAGTVSELSTFKAGNPSGAGTITSLYGFYCEDLTRGATNYAIYTDGVNRSFFGYGFKLGQIATPAQISYNSVSGNLEISPRTTYNVFIDAPILIGQSGLEATIKYNTVSGNLDLIPRTGYNACVPSGALLVGLTAPASTEKLNITGTSASYITRLNNSNASPLGLAIVYPSAAPNGAGNEFLYCQDSGAIRMKVLSNGNCVNVTGTYGTISDIKYKERVTPANPMLNRLLQVEIVNYFMKSDPDVKLLGQIAQDLEKIFPGMVEDSPDMEEVEVEPARVEVRKVRRQKKTTTQEQQIKPELVNGVWVGKPVMTEVSAPAFEHHPVIGEDGAPVMVLAMPAQKEKRRGGRVIQAAQEAVYQPMMHPVPIMEEVEEHVDIPAVIERRPTGTFSKSVKTSVFIPILIKSLQEEHARVSELEARIAAIESLVQP